MVSRAGGHLDRELKESELRAGYRGREDSCWRQREECVKTWR